MFLGGFSSNRYDSRRARSPMKTLLIADDEPSLRLLVTATLASDQYTIVEAAAPR